MNLSQLYYFRKLAEVKHYTHAAEELFISQPTLSNSISQLEKELGIPLFKREGRTIKLTRYGAEFYEYATEALNALEKGIALAKEHAGSRREASISGPSTPSRATISLRLSRVIARHMAEALKSTSSKA